MADGGQADGAQENGVGFASGFFDARGDINPVFGEIPGTGQQRFRPDFKPADLLSRGFHHGHGGFADIDTDAVAWN